MTWFNGLIFFTPFFHFIGHLCPFLTDFVKIGNVPGAYAKISSQVPKLFFAFFRVLGQNKHFLKIFQNFFLPECHTCMYHPPGLSRNGLPAVKRGDKPTFNVHAHIAGCVESGPYLVVMKMCRGRVMHALILHTEDQMHSELKMLIIFQIVVLDSIDYQSMMT